MLWAENGIVREASLVMDMLRGHWPGVKSCILEILVEYVEYPKVEQCPRNPFPVKPRRGHVDDSRTNCGLKVCL